MLGTVACFQRLEVPSAEERAPTLVKAFTYASHSRRLSAPDVETLKSQLEGEELELFSRLLEHLDRTCSGEDIACARGKFREVSELYRDYSGADPENFEVQLTVASGLFMIGQSAIVNRIDEGLGRSLVTEGRDRVSRLAERFPEEPMVHGQLAFMKTFEEGAEDEVSRHIKRCLALDPTTDWCRKLARRY